MMTTANMMTNLKERYRRFRAWQENPFDYTNHSEHATRCANCGTEFRDNFCPRCGQNAGVGPIGWNTVRQGIMILWGMDSRSLGFTLIQLILRPGYLVRDYISGKRQVAFPPVKMLFIVAIVNMLADRLNEMLHGSAAAERTPFSDNLAYMNQVFMWMDENTAWCTLLLMTLFILPTWLFFRWSPRYPRHNLPEGFFLQVFMASLLLLMATVAKLAGGWFTCLYPVCCIVTYRQLFGYGWWGTFWRYFFCVVIGLGLMILIFIVTYIWYNGTI